MDVIKENQKKRIQRYPVTAPSSSSLRVISFETREMTRHDADVVNISMTGAGVESDGPLKPGLVWFKEYVGGHKCGVLVWCKHVGIRYRAGIQFLDLNHGEEEYLKEQFDRFQFNKPLPSPDMLDHMISRVQEVQTEACALARDTDGITSSVVPAPRLEE